MSNIDLFILITTLLGISLYGAYKNHSNKNLKSYILGNNSLNWRTVGLSVMATQASAITFLSTPGQGYVDGMSFIQNYLGLPLALLIVSFVFVPIYYNSGVYTAYEYLERRFDSRVRLLTSFFFLLPKRTTMWNNNICTFNYSNNYFRLGYDYNSNFSWFINNIIHNYWW